MHFTTDTRVIYSNSGSNCIVKNNYFYLGNNVLSVIYGPANFSAFIDNYVFEDSGIVNNYANVNASSRFGDISYARRGDNMSKPVLPAFAEFVGFDYYDTDLLKVIYWNGTVWTDALGTEVTVPVTFNLKNLTSSTYVQPNIGTMYDVTLSAAEGYALPDAITITMGGTPLVLGTDYRYNKNSGRFVIDGFGGEGGVTSALEIIASGIEQQTE
jgi:hypothetical protein